MKEVFHARQLPPDPFPISTLSGAEHKPTLEELKTLLEFRHLVKCVEHHVRQDEEYRREDHEARRKKSDVPEFSKSWRERFHRSMYRVFLAGAVLYGPYHQPFSADGQTPPGFLDSFQKKVAAQPRGGGRHFPEKVLSEADIKYLLKFPVYDLSGCESHDISFGPLATHFVNESQARAEQESDSASWVQDRPTGTILDRFEADQQILFHDILQFLFAYEHLCGFDKRTGLLSSRTRIDGFARYDRAGRSPRQARRVSVVLFGNFVLEEIVTPVVIPSTRGVLLHLNSTPVLQAHEANGDTITTPFRHVDLLLNHMHRTSGRPNSYGLMYPAPHPPLQFIRYLLRKYLDLRFTPGAFTILGWSPCMPYAHVFANAKVFSELGHFKNPIPFESANLPIPELMFQFISKEP